MSLHLIVKPRKSLWISGIAVLFLIAAAAPLPAVSGPCGMGWEAYGVYVPPGEWGPPWPGEMEWICLTEDVGGYDISFQVKRYGWSPTFNRVYTLWGGGDVDICVSLTDPNDYYPYYDGVDVTAHWGLLLGGSPSNAGFADYYYPRMYYFFPPKPAEQTVDQYRLTGWTDDFGPFNAGDEQTAVWADLHVYYPYGVGEPVRVIINKLTIGKKADVIDPVFLKPATYRWKDQFLSGEIIEFTTYLAEDYDTHENGIPPLNWQDGPVNDIPTSDYGLFDWDAIKGSFLDGSDNTPAAIYICPIVETLTTVFLHLYLDDAPLPEYADDLVPAHDQLSFRVYKDHLQRDMANEADLNIQVPGGPQGACFGAAMHAWNGTEGTVKPPWGSGGPPSRIIYSAPANPNSPPTIPLNTAGVNRGDVLMMGKQGYGASHCCTATGFVAGGKLGIWEYNGRLHPNSWGTACLEDFLPLVDDGERVVQWIRVYPRP
jgi:hypothetical protein